MTGQGASQALVHRLRAAAPSALDALPVRFAYLFGSRAEGRVLPDSDVDVAVVLEGEHSADEAFRIGGDCGEALGAASGVQDIEVTVLDDAPLRFVGRVLRQRIVIYSRDEPGRVAFESLKGRMADDVEYWAAPLDRELIARHACGRR